MNRAFKVVWNTLRRQFVVVNEFQSSKKKTKSTAAAAAVLSALTLLGAGNALAYDYSYFTDGFTDAGTLVGPDVNKAVINTSGQSSAVFDTNVYGLGISNGIKDSYTPLRVIGSANVVFNADAYFTNITNDYTVFVGKINMEGASVNFAEGDVVLTGVSSYGAVGMVFYPVGSTQNDITFSNSGKVVFNSVLAQGTGTETDATFVSYGHSGIGQSNVIGYQGDGQTLTVTDKVTSFTINTYGSGIFKGSTNYSNGTVAFRAKGDTVSINSKEFVINAVAGQDYTAEFELEAGGPAKSVPVTFDREAALTVGTDYSVTYGIDNLGTMNIGADTKVTVNVSDGFWNAVGLRNDPLYVDNSSPKYYQAAFEALGDVAINVTGANQGGTDTKHTLASNFERLQGTYGILAGNSTLGSLEATEESTVTLGSAGKTVSITVSEFRDAAGSYVESAANGDSNYNIQYVGVQAADASVSLNGSVNTVDVSARSDVYGIKALAGSTVTAGTDSSSSTSVTANSGYNAAFAVYADGGSVSLKGDRIAVTSNGQGLTALSSGTIEAAGNLTLTAAQTIAVSDGGTVNINTAGDYIAVISGDIVFGSASKESASASSVNLVLKGTDSFWTGASVSNSTGVADNFALTLAEGAAWTVSGDSFVTTLSVAGTGNQILNSDGYSLDVGTLAFADGSSLSTNLNTAYTGITVADGILTGAETAAFTNVTVDGSASLSISDAFTFSTSGMNALFSAYEKTDGLTVVLEKATLALAAGETSVSIPQHAEVNFVAKGESADVASGAALSIDGRVNLVADTASSVKAAHLGTAAVNSTGTLGIHTAVTADSVSVAKGGQLLIGSGDKTGTFTVASLDLQGTMFIDPSWESGEGPSTAAVSLKDDKLSGTIIVARNSEVEIGSDSVENLEKTLASLGRTVAKDDLLSVARVNTPITLEGGSLIVDGTLDSAPSSAPQGVLVEKGSALIVNGAAGSDGTAVITSNGGDFTVNGTLYIDNTAAGRSITIASGFDSITADTVESFNRLISITPSVSGGALTAEAAVNSALTEASLASITLAAAAFGAEGAGADRINALFVQSSGLTNTEALQKINGIALMGTASAAQSAAVNSVSMIADTLERHGSVLASYSHDKRGADLWLDLNGSFSKATRYHAGSESYGYKSDLAGVTIGADYALGNGLALGGAFSFGTGSARGQGAGAGIKNDIQYYGFNLYGVWNTPYANLIGSVGYTLGKNDISHAGYKGKPDVNTFSAAVRAEKDFSVAQNLTVTPHAGLRYMNVDMESFTAGGFRYSAKKLNLAQVPVGVSVSAETKTSCGAALKPFADFTVAPTLGSKNAKNTFGLAGGSASDTFSARVTNSALYQGKIGLEAAKGSHSLGLSYGVGAGSNGRVDQNLQAKYRYSF
jgi:hypothetical protein